MPKKKGKGGRAATPAKGDTGPADPNGSISGGDSLAHLNPPGSSDTPTGDPPVAAGATGDAKEQAGDSGGGEVASPKGSNGRQGGGHRRSPRKRAGKGAKDPPSTPLVDGAGSTESSRRRSPRKSAGKRGKGPPPSPLVEAASSAEGSSSESDEESGSPAQSKSGDAGILDALAQLTENPLRSGGGYRQTK